MLKLLKTNKCILAMLGILGIGLMCYFIFESLTAENFDYNFYYRLKIVGAITVVSVAVGVAVVIFQTITTNYILSPSIMGLDNLYIFLQTIVIYYWGSSQLAMMNGVYEFAISLVLMVIASTGLFFFMFRKMDKSIYFIVLVGIVFGIAFDGLASFMQVIIDPNEFATLEGKMFASFNNINLDLLGATAIIVFGACLWLFLDLKNLDVLSLGRENAITLGLNYKRIVLKSLIIVSILTSASTVLVGPITFLGILVVSIARFLFQTYRHSVLITGTVLISFTCLMAGTLVTKLILNYSVPLSVTINFVGGIAFIYLMLKKKKI